VSDTILRYFWNIGASQLPIRVAQDLDKFDMSYQV